MKKSEKHVCKKDYIWNLAKCGCKNGKKNSSIIDDSVIRWDETIPTKTVSRDFNEKEVTCKKKNLYFTHLFINYHSIIDSC